MEEQAEKDQGRPDSTYRQRTIEPAITYRDVYGSYRQLLNDLSLHLTQDNVKSVVFLRLVPEQVSNQGHLAVLRCLDQRGEIAWNRTDSLRALLRDINRIDLAHSHLRQYEVIMERYISQEERKKASSAASGTSKYSDIFVRLQVFPLWNLSACGADQVQVPLVSCARGDSTCTTESFLSFSCTSSCRLQQHFRNGRAIVPCTLFVAGSLLFTHTVSDL